jgi:predicted RecB family endonuclease
VKRVIKDAFAKISTHGDQGKDAVKAVRQYARVTGASPEAVATYAHSVADELEKLAYELGVSR